MTIANQLKEFISKISHPDDDDTTEDSVLRTYLAHKGLTVLDKHFTLSIEELVTLRDLVGPEFGTNCVYRFVSAYNALRPGAKVFPTRIKALFAEFDGTDNLEVTTQEHLLLVSTCIEGWLLQKMLPHMYVNWSLDLAAMIKENSILD